MIQPYNSEQPNVSFTNLQHLDRSTELNTLFLEKQRNARLLLPNFSLPELREEAAYEIHYRIQEAERRLVAPNLAEEDYELGTATHDDDLFVLSNTGNGLFISAEHATSPVASANRSGADMGTGGLAYVLAKDNDATAVVAIGRQTVSPEKPSGHATKAFISERAASIDRFVAIHGMTSGKVLGGQDDTEIQAILGLGAQPNERTYEFAKKVKNHAKDILGLRVTLGEEDYIILAGDPLAFKRSENGEVKKISTKRIEPKFNRYTY